jgi:hypothetical protein
LFDLLEILELLSKEKVKGAEVNLYDIVSKVAAYHYPSVAIIFSRAEIACGLNQDLSKQYIRSIKEGRVHLELDPDSDPINEILEFLTNKERYRGLDKLVNDLEQEVAVLESNNDDLRRQLSKKSKTNKALGIEVEELKLKVIGDKEYRKLKAERDELLPRVDQLRMENRTFSTMIADLKGENRALREKVAESESSPATQEITLEVDALDDDEAIDIGRMPKTFTIPIFEETFLSSIKRLDVAIQRKAWDYANGFAATRKDIWKKTCPLKGLKGYYRIKFEQAYRIMLKWENGDAMHFIEVVRRQDMDTWIKNKS